MTMGAQIPYVALDSYDPGLTVDGRVFKGRGKVVAPFTMMNINKEKRFATLGKDEYVFISWSPLFDRQYWLFYLKGRLEDKRWLSDGQAYYGQGTPLLTGDFEFSYSTVSVPFMTQKINLNLRRLPYTYPTRQARTGQIPGVELSEYYGNNIVTFDSLKQSYIPEGILRQLMLKRFWSQGRY